MRLLVMLITFFLTSPALAEKRIALVLGNDAYKNVDPLKKAVNDSKAIAKTLNKLGFEVIQGENLTRSQTNLKIQQFLNKINPGDITMLFYAGHGVEVKGLNYLLPVDIPQAKPGYEAYVTSEAISVDDLLFRLRQRKARITIMVLDACRDNPFKLKGGRSLGGKRGLARLQAPEGTFIMYSAGTGESALDRLSESDPNPNSVYTRTLIPMLKTPGIGLRTVAKNTRREVKKIAATVGHKQTPAYYDEFIGEFNFSEGGRAQPSPPAGQIPAPVAGDTSESLKARTELTFWDSIKTSTNPEAYSIYLEKYPNGTFASLAKLKLKELQEKEEADTKKLAAKKQADLPGKSHSPRPRSYREQCKSRTSDAGVDLYCVSSVLPPQRGNFYGVDSLLDDDNRTAWIEGKKGHGIGEWVTVQFDGLRTVKAIRLKNGYSKRRDIYRKNSRIKAVELFFSGGERQTFTIKDDPSSKIYNLHQPVKAKWVQVIIQDVVPGRKYKDTAINEIRVITASAK